MLASFVMDVVYRLSTVHAGGVSIVTPQSVSAHRVIMVISTACDIDLYGLQYQKHKSKYHTHTHTDTHSDLRSLPPY